MKIFNFWGGGYFSDTLSGMQWVYDDYEQKVIDNGGQRVKNVVSMSWGRTGTEKTLVDAITHDMADLGLVLVAAAGNSNEDTCLDVAPGRSSSVITVGATDISDTLTGFSNNGPCVDIQAPGVQILSCGTSNPDSSTTKSGTSMAAPHVAGVLSSYLSRNKYVPTPFEVRALLLENSSKGLLAMGDSPETRISTPNRLLHLQCE